MQRLVILRATLLLRLHFFIGCSEMTHKIQQTTEVFFCLLTWRLVLTIVHIYYQWYPIVVQFKLFQNIWWSFYVNIFFIYRNNVENTLYRGE